MSRLFAHIRKFLKTYIITALVSAVIGVTIFMLYYFLNDRTLLAAINGTSMAGIILLGVGLLCLVARLGAFDTMSYGFRQMFSSMFAKEANKYNDMVEYKQDKNAKRARSSYYYVVMMIVSVFFFIAFIALEIYKTQVFHF